jgi:hypothetical protein
MLDRFLDLAGCVPGRQLRIRAVGVWVGGGW